MALQKKSGAPLERCAPIPYYSSPRRGAVQPHQQLEEIGMRAVIVTTTRRVRALEVRTGEHNGRRQIFLQAFWQGDDDLMHPSGPRMWLPAESADEIIAALIQANNELKAEGSRA